MESFLKDGTRWGCQFHFHLIRDPEHPYSFFKTFVDENSEEKILLGHADAFPQMEWKEKESFPLMFCYPKTGENFQWTGWGIFSLEMFQDISDVNREEFSSHLLKIAEKKGKMEEVKEVLKIGSYKDLLESHCKILDKKFSGLILKGREVDPGICLSRNVILPPTVSLHPPLYIAEDCQIQQGVKIGPYASIGKGCIVERKSVVENSVVFSQSYVGEGLEVKNSIVDKNFLANLIIDSEITIKDDFLLGSLSENIIKNRFMSLISRLTAMLLLLLFSPILFFAIIISKLVTGKAWQKREVVALPAPTDPDEWKTFFLWSFAQDESKNQKAGIKHFFLHFLPALMQIASGKLRFVGVPPRSLEQIKSLLSDWRLIYLKTKSGIITEASIQENIESQDELYAAEAFYAASYGILYDLKNMMKYFLNIF